MLDAPHARRDRRVRAFVAMRMRHHRDAARRRFLDDRAQLPLVVDLLARIGVGESRPRLSWQVGTAPTEYVQQRYEVETVVEDPARGTPRLLRSACPALLS